MDGTTTNGRAGRSRVEAERVKVHEELAADARQVTELLDRSIAAARQKVTSASWMSRNLIRDS